jgi:hypothetical protein
MENWKQIVGFENLYEISDLGNLRSVERYVKHYKGGLRLYKGMCKTNRLNSKGYLRCNLKSEGNSKDCTIHRLVAMAFIDNHSNKPAVNHINGIKTDNRVENLEWVTQSENVVHAVETRLIKTRLTDVQALEIFNSKLSLRKLGKIYSVNSSIIWRIKNKQAYKHLFK